MPEPKPSRFPVMEHMTVKQVRAYLARKQSILIPMGVTEQHGYHLPLSTDATIATELGRRIGGLADVLVAPTMYESFSGGGLPGTVNISPAVMSLVVSDRLVSLAAQGFRHFYLWLCHGGSENERALEDALRILLRTNPTFQESLIALLPVWRFGRRCADGWGRAIREHDWHAGWLETSLMLALAPELVRMDELETDPEPLLSLQIEHPDNYQHAEKMVDDPVVIPRLTQRPDIQVGVMGHPEQADRELGERATEAIVAEVADKIQDLEARADGVYEEVEFTPEPIVLE